MFSLLVTIIFIILCCPLWIVLGLIKGFFDFLFFMISKFYWVFEQNFLVDNPLPFPLEDTLASFIVIPWMAIWEGVKGFLNPMLYLWDFSRNEHPALIFFICLGLSFFYFVYLPEKLKTKQKY